MGVPLGVENNLDANGNGAESGSTGDAHDQDSGADTRIIGDGDEEQPPSKNDDSDSGEYEEGEGEDAFLSMLEAESAPPHLLFEEEEDVDDGRGGTSS